MRALEAASRGRPNGPEVKALCVSERKRQRRTGRAELESLRELHKSRANFSNARSYWRYNRIKFGFKCADFVKIHTLTTIKLIKFT